MVLEAYRTIEQVLQAYVVTHRELSALVGNRFFPMIVPQNVEIPYGRYQRISSPRISSHSGPSCLASPRFQVDWIGGAFAQGLMGYGAAAELAQIFRFALQDFRGTLLTIRVDRIEFADERDFFDDDTKLVGRSQDLIIWHAEES